MTRMSGSDNATDTAIESKVIGPVKHRRLEINFWNDQDTQRRIKVKGESLFVRPNPFLRPENERDAVFGYWLRHLSRFQLRSMWLDYRSERDPRSDSRVKP